MYNNTYMHIAILLYKFRLHVSSQTWSRLAPETALAKHQWASRLTSESAVSVSSMSCVNTASLIISWICSLVPRAKQTKLEILWTIHSKSITYSQSVINPHYTIIHKNIIITHRIHMIHTKNEKCITKHLYNNNKYHYMHLYPLNTCGNIREGPACLLPNKLSGRLKQRTQSRDATRSDHSLGL